MKSFMKVLIKYNLLKLNNMMKKILWQILGGVDY